MTFEEFIGEWRNEDKTISVRTSGSTGKPKDIRLDKEFVRRSAERTNSFFSINSGSRLHSCVAADFIGGKMMGVRSEIAGCRLSWETPSNRPLSQINPNERIDLLAVVPSQMVHILDNIGNLPEIGAIIIGGSAIHPDLRNRIAAKGLNAYETYGMTETASHIALRKIDGEEEWFRPLPGIIVGSDSRGCLTIGFPQGEEEVVTNDLVEFSADAEGFKILGRFDNVIITGGKKVNPEDVESRLAEYIDGRFMIASKPDEKWGERIVLRIENGARLRLAFPEGFKAVLKTHEVPKEIDWVSALPTTPNGKLKRR